MGASPCRSIVFITRPDALRMTLRRWQVGKLHSKAGPQYSFPLHPGLLNTDGKNTLALALWSVGTQPADLKIQSIKLRAGNIVQGGIGCVALTAERELKSLTRLVASRRTQLHQDKQPALRASMRVAVLFFCTSALPSMLLQLASHNCAENRERHSDEPRAPSERL